MLLPLAVLRGLASLLCAAMLLGASLPPASADGSIGGATQAAFERTADDDADPALPPLALVEQRGSQGRRAFDPPLLPCGRLVADRAFRPPIAPKT